MEAWHVETDDRQLPRLEELENRLEQRLVPQLRKCAMGFLNLMFASRHYLHDEWPKNVHRAETDEILRLCLEIIALRDDLDESTENCLAEDFRAACQLWADTDAPERNNASRIARQLLEKHG
jgi:hypothetical protein